MLTHQHLDPVVPKRVVVIGAGGFVGSSIVSELASNGVPTVPLTRKEVDLLQPGSADALAGHLARDDAVVFVSAIAPARTPAQLIVNLRMAELACSAFAAVPPACLLYISSDAVYADDVSPITERSAVSPSTLHGMMHAARELTFRTQYRGPFAVLRPSLIYGAADPHSGYGPNRFRRQAAKGEPIAIFGDGEEKRDHIAVEDVARLAIRIVLHRSGGVLNAVTGVSTSFNEIAHIVARQFSPPAGIKSAPRSGPLPRVLHRFFDIADCHKSFPDFRFEPLAQGLARVHREVMRPDDERRVASR